VDQNIKKCRHGEADIAPGAHKKRIRQNGWRTAVLSLLVLVENIKFLE